MLRQTYNHGQFKVNLLVSLKTLNRVGKRRGSFRSKLVKEDINFFMVSFVTFKVNKRRENIHSETEELFIVKNSYWKVRQLTVRRSLVLLESSLLIATA